MYIDLFASFVYTNGILSSLPDIYLMVNNVDCFKMSISTFGASQF